MPRALIAVTIPTKLAATRQSMHGNTITFADIIQYEAWKMEVTIKAFSLSAIELIIKNIKVNLIKENVRINSI